MSLATIPIAPPVKHCGRAPTLAERVARIASEVGKLGRILARTGIDPWDFDRQALMLHHDHEAIIRAIARRHRRKRLPTWAEWKYSTAPIWTHREGGRIYLVVPAENGNVYGDDELPESVDVLIRFARLVVIDDPCAPEAGR